MIMKDQDDSKWQQKTQPYNPFPGPQILRVIFPAEDKTESKPNPGQDAPGNNEEAGVIFRFELLRRSACQERDHHLEGKKNHPEREKTVGRRLSIQNESINSQKTGKARRENK